MTISITTPQDIENFENSCKKLVNEDKIRHVAVINRLGRNIASSTKKGIKTLLDDEKLRTVYMQLYLDYSMRKELDEILGTIDYISSRRKNVVMINIPTHEYLILISTERDVNVEDIIRKASKAFPTLHDIKP